MNATTNGDRKNPLSVIDAHAHVIEFLRGVGYRGEMRPLGKGEGRWAAGETIQVIPVSLGEREFTYQRLLGVMDRCGVEKAVLLQGSLYGYQNEYSYEAVKAHPDRFVSLGSFDPYCLEADGLMRRWIDEFGFKGLKFEMSAYGGFMGYHSDFRIDGPYMRPVWSFAAERGLVVSLDIGSFGDPSFQLDAILGIARQYTRIPVVIEHMFCPPANSLDKVSECLQAIRPYPQISVTLASLPSMAAPETFPYPSVLSYVKTGRDVIGAERMLWGSDAPITLTAESYERLLRYIPEAGLLTEGELRLVFHDNAKRVYGL